MPWLLNFISDLIQELPENLNAEVVHENDEIEVVVLEADELWGWFQGPMALVGHAFQDTASRCYASRASQ